MKCVKGRENVSPGCNSEGLRERCVKGKKELFVGEGRRCLYIILSLAVIA
jgi:hypothetical protein